MKTTLNNIKIEVREGFYVIESNKGNHSGHNRTWKQWTESFETRKDARRAMADEANERNNVSRGQHGYTRISDDRAWCDGATLAVVNHHELIDRIKGTGTNLANIHAITVLEEEAVA